MSKQYDTVAVAGRILIGVLFFMSGLSKLAAPAATQGYIASVGLPLLRRRLRCWPWPSKSSAVLLLICRRAAPASWPPAWRCSPWRQP